MKPNLTVDDLKVAGAEIVAHFNKTYVRKIGDVSKPGYYFVVVLHDSVVQCRYYSGRQRTKQGFSRTINHIRNGRSEISRSLIDKGELIAYYIPVEKIKKLLNLNRSFLTRAFATTASDKFENISECNLQLSDQYKFVLQDY